MSETADAKGLPLRQAIIRYQFPRPDDPEGMTAAELVQRYCDIACFDVPFRFQFMAQGSLFDIMNKAHLNDALAAAEADPENEMAEGVPLLGSFYIGDDAPSMWDFSTEGSLFDVVQAKMQKLHTLLEGSLHAPWNAERLRVYGRMNNPMGDVSLTSADSFGLFTITDWDKGIATADGTTLYAVRVEHIDQMASSPRESGRPATVIEGKNKSALFARYWLQQTRFGETKPEGVPWKVIRGDYLAWAEQPQESTIDEDTMQKGIALANQHRRGGNSKPSVS